MPVGKRFEENANDAFTDAWLLEQIDLYKSGFRTHAEHGQPIDGHDLDIYGLLITIHNMRRQDTIYRDKIAWFFTGTWIIVIALIAGLLF